DAARTMLADLGFRSLAARVPTTWRDGSTMSAPPIFAPPAREQGRLPLDEARPPAQSTLALESPSEAVTIVREPGELARLVAAFAAADRPGFEVITLEDVPRAGRVAARAIEGREGLFGSGKTAMTCDQVDIARAAAFFGERMRVMLQLAPRLQSELERLGNAELFRDLEMPLVPVLGEMELAGVSVDLPYLQQLSRELYEQLPRLDQDIADVAHGPTNVNSPQHLATFRCADLNLSGRRKRKRRY